MDNHIRVTYAGLESASTNVKGEATKIKNELDALDRRVNSVVSNWQGEASRLFHERHRNWGSNVQDMHETLLAIAAKLLDASHGYFDVDHKAANRFR
ncbi:WXG100 family type VII secretion target [Streptomyces sp. I05A-00742]|uniref:WXG100 family type VII secretion target n=1 Tax=Streptomyces sp. I05A-00742 TaxID=2732853 RepID=UPI0014885D76|nr:WXG100 family type VII secretion target [Streptomyces sp. I05A-00742]